MYVWFFAVSTLRLCLNPELLFACAILAAVSNRSSCSLQRLNSHFDSIIPKSITHFKTSTSTVMPRRCSSQSDEKSYPSIEVTANDRVCVGRAPQYGLSDGSVSWEQLKLRADMARKSISIGLLGATTALNWDGIVGLRTGTVTLSQ